MTVIKPGHPRGGSGIVGDPGIDEAVRAWDQVDGSRLLLPGDGIKGCGFGECEAEMLRPLAVMAGPNALGSSRRRAFSVLSPLADGATLQWGIYSAPDGSGPPPPSHWQAANSRDDFASYIARNGPPGSGGSYTDQLNCGTATIIAPAPPSRWFVQWRACALFNTPSTAPLNNVSLSFEIKFKHGALGNQRIATPLIPCGNGDRYQLTAGVWRDYQAECTLLNSDIAQANNQILVSTSIQAAFAGYVAVTWVRAFGYYYL